MGQKKNKKLLIILIILLIVLILLIGVSVAYFATDTFKSNKELFFKYLSQMGDEQEGIVEDSLKAFFEKQGTTPYSDEGSISINISTSNGQNQFDATNDMNLTFSGQVNNLNSQVEQNISLNYTDDVTFPLIYRQIEDEIGIQTDYIGSKFITTSSLQNMLSGEANIEDIEKIDEISNIELTEEDIEYIQSTYIGFLNTQLNDNYFSKIEENNNKGYKLTLTGEELKTIFINLLETLKNDQRTLEKLNEYLKVQRNSSSITASKIDNLIREINNEQGFDKYNLEVIVYQSNGKISGLNIKLNEYEFKITKNSSENNLQYELEVKNNDSKIALNANYTGINELQNVIENYELILETENIKYQYNYNNNLNFIADSNIEDFNNDNSLSLDNMDEEQLNTFMTAVVERIQNVNKKQMEELDLQEDENPLRYVLPQMDLFGIETNTDELNEMDISTFNARFENYASTNLKGVTVKGLITTISINNGLDEEDDEQSDEDEGNRTDNQNDDYLIKEIHFDGEEYEVNRQNIAQIKDSIETDSYYRVEFEKDESTGIIYRAVINKK